MATVPNKVKIIIDQFLEELANNNIKIDEAVLFGSYAQGTFNDWSDIDLAIVSKSFKGERFEDRDKIRRIKLKISCDLEPIPYSPEEFNVSNPFVRNIMETGINVV